MTTCENCGSKIYSLGCINCNEESYIFYDQIYPNDLPASEEFMNTVKDQEKRNERRTRTDND